MPAVSSAFIVNEVIDAIQQSGGVAAYVAESFRTPVGSPSVQISICRHP